MTAGGAAGAAGWAGVGCVDISGVTPAGAASSASGDDAQGRRPPSSGDGYDVAVTSSPPDAGRIAAMLPAATLWRSVEVIETTEVTETFDYSWARPAVRRAYELLRVPADNGRGIQSSLTRLAGRHL